MSSVTDLEGRVLAALPGLPQYVISLTLQLGVGQLPVAVATYYTGFADLTDTVTFQWTGEKFERQPD